MVKQDLVSVLMRASQSMSKLAAAFVSVYSKGYYIKNERGRNKLVDLRNRK